METIRKAAKIQSIRVDRPLSIYIAARYGRKAEALEIATELEKLGHTINSSWIHQVEDEMLYTEGPEAAGRFAAKDLEEIFWSNLLVYLSEPEDNPWGRGGRHVEFGYALGQNKTVFVIGPLENLFHYLSSVTNFSSVDDFFHYLMEESR